MLRDLLGSLSLDSFWDSYWEKDSYVSRAALSEPASLLSLAELEYLAYSLSASDAAWLRLMKDGRELPESAYRSCDGGVNLASVGRAFNEGFTLQLSRLHRRSEAIAQLCRMIENDFLSAGAMLSDRVGAHAYLTPPHSQGLSVHADYQDVFVLQLEGEKEWKIWTWTPHLPVSQSYQAVDSNTLPPVKETVVLAAGDVLYIPRGVYHEASTSDGFSLHLSLSVYPLTWADFLVKTFSSTVFGRTALPRVTTPVVKFFDHASDECRECVGSACFASALSSAYAQLQSDLLKKLNPLPRHGERLMKATSSSPVPTSSQYRRTLEPCVLLEDGPSSVCLQWLGGSLRASGATANALRYIIGRPSFDSSDLQLDPHSRQTLLEVLQNSYIVTLVTDGEIE